MCYNTTMVVFKNWGVTMSVRNILFDTLKKGVLLVAIVCMQGITQAKAEICFLPSGECKIKMSIQSESCKGWSSAEREQVCGAKNGYIKAEQVAAKESTGYTCTSALSLGDTCCPGWYYCTEKNCQDQGFKLKEQQDPRYYVCEPCTQGGVTFYKCEDKPCNYNSSNPSASTLEDVCTNANAGVRYCIDSIGTNLCKDGYVWKADSSRRAGTRSCGTCVKSDNPPTPPACTGEDCVRCKNDTYYWKETLPSGCVSCTVAGDVTGREYYCCHDITEYPVANCVDDDSACYTCDGPIQATGFEYYNETGEINCYKHVDKKCANANQYIDRKIDGCYCRDYDYYLDANPTTIHFTAAGGTATVNVVSTISTHSSTSSYPYVTQTGKVGLCTVTDNGSGTVTVKCSYNTSTSAKSTSFNITQTPKKVTTTHKVLRETITITIDGDTCYQYQFSQTCSLAGYVAEYRRKSESGQANCYQCVNDNCPSGYTKGATPNPTAGYLTAKTDHGSNCYKAKTCNTGCSTTNRRNNGECYNCSSCGYAGQAQCWSCEHMSTVCDTANGWNWSESSCGCVAVGCTTGDISKQKVEDCGSSGSKGWTYSYSGMSGGKKCGICKKKSCSGNSTTDLSLTNSNYSCTNCWYGDTQRFTCTCNLTDALCGAGKKADMTTCTCKTCEDNCSKHSWTSDSSTCRYGSTAQSAICNIQCYSCNACTDTCANHTGWLSSCSNGCNGNYKVTCTNQTDDCGSRCYTKDETYCKYGCTNGECNSCTDSCSNHSGWVSTCSKGCNGNYKVSCTKKTDDCGGRCYVKDETYCTYGCTNGECNACTDTCSKHTGWESSCTSGCNGDYKVTCTNQTDDCGGRCYTKDETYCKYGCSNGSCNSCTDSCSNHSGWVSTCSKGCNGKYKVSCTNKTDDCGSRCYVKNETYCKYGCTNGECNACTDTCPVSGEKKNASDLSCSCGTTTGTSTQCGTTCYKCKPNDTCANHGWKNYASSCTYGYNEKTDNCGHTCYECKPCTPGDGWWGSVCCSDSDCKASSELPLYCFDGECLECGSFADDCKVNSRFYSKYGSGATGCYLANHHGPGGSYQYDASPTPIDTIKEIYRLKKSCRSGECINQ